MPSAFFGYADEKPRPAAAAWPATLLTAPNRETIDVTSDWQRCFIALAPDAPTRHRLANLDRYRGAARALHAEDLHLTLAFLGGISHAVRAALEASLPSLAWPVPPLPFTGIEWWPDVRHARVQVASFASAPELARMLQQLRPALDALELPVDHRPFRPHITLARVPRKHTHPALQHSASAPLPAFAAGFDAICLYARDAASGERRYQLLARQPLA